MAKDDDMKKYMSDLFNAPDQIDDDDIAGEEDDIFSITSSGQSFEQKAKDLELVVEKEKNDDEEKNAKKIIKSAKKAAQKAVDNKTPKMEESKAEEVEDDDDTVETDDDDILAQADKDTMFVVNPDNPLGLDDRMLEVYHVLDTDYKDKFVLYDDSPQMRPFYAFKVKELGFILSRYPLLNCESLAKEIGDIDLDHSIEGVAHGKVIAEKLNNIVKQRQRLTEILIQVHGQCPLWEKITTMLRGKLWMCKDVKGQHKREGIVADHMSDIIHYVASLRSIIDSAEHINNLLIASTDSISRQLTCLQESKRYDDEDRIRASDDDGRDEVREGTFIQPSHVDKPDLGRAGKLKFSDENDDFSNIG